MTKETIIKSTLKYLVKRQIAEGSVGFAVDNDHDHDCCWDDVLAWIEAQSCEEDFVKHKKEVLERIAKREREIDKYIKELEALEQQPKPMEKFDDVKTHIQRLAGDYKCWDNRLTWEEALELNRMLEAQPSEDCISREAVRKVLSNEVFELMKLHTVNPEDNPKADAMAHGVNWSLNTLMELPPVTPQRLKGKWIKCKSRFGTEYFKCSECGRKLNWIDSDDNYCNSCGSDNSESTKELYKEKLAEISGGGEDETSD